LKLNLAILVILVAAVSAGTCPHSLNKRQIGRRPNIGGPNNNNNGRPDDNNNDGPDDNRKPPPPSDQGNGDRRPRPTDQPTQPPVPVNVNSCDRNKRYSQADGACNNLEHPNWGRAVTEFKRYLDSDYADGSSAARTKSVFGQNLPNPRLLSSALMSDNSQFESEVSDLLVYFGQWLAHDFAEIIDTKRNDEFVDCPCGSTDADCLSYIKPPADTEISQSCFTFTRTGSETRFNKREQVNHLSSFVDASQVYGRDKTVQDELRSFQGGKMLTSSENYLPRSDSDFTCSSVFDLPCFVGGEDRPSENLALTSIHTLFLREHNRLAAALQSRHRDWSDETLYQEARKINIAQMQHIIYNEWLPLIVGPSSDLAPQSSGYYSGYSSGVSPSLANEFGVAAFRFGHTLIRNSIDRYNINHLSVNAPLNLSAIIFDSTESYNTAYGLGGIEAIFMGLLNQPTAKFDSAMVDTLRNHLFEFEDENGDVFALDLAATNINRARDHGVPAYYRYVELCTGRTVSNWNSLASVMSAANIAKLRTMYASFRDIDLFVGGLHETPANDAVVGPTFACIIKKQFADLKNGDRFYYENGPSATSFSTTQLSEVRQVTMSSLLCLNYGMNTIQRRAFEMPYAALGNSRVPCSQIRNLNIFRF